MKIQGKGSKCFFSEVLEKVKWEGSSLEVEGIFRKVLEQIFETILVSTNTPNEKR